MDIGITYGIVTDGADFHRIEAIINSLGNNGIPENKYQIIVVGGGSVCGKNVLHIPFDESTKVGWITRKKNLITKHALFDNIVYSHDYICPELSWYRGMCEFGDDFDVCCNRILTVGGGRFRDWILSAARLEQLSSYLSIPLRRNEGLLPYHITHLNHFVIVGGYYWVAKKKVMEEFPLEEKLSWGDGEDYRWFHAVQVKYRVAINSHASLRLLKLKNPWFVPIDQDKVTELEALRVPVGDLKNDYPYYEYCKPIDW